VLRRTLDNQEICDVLAALDTADSPYVLLSVVHSMLRAPRCRNSRAPTRDGSAARRGQFLAPERRVKCDHAVPMTPAIAALFSRPKNINARYSYSRATRATRFPVSARPKSALNKEINKRRKEEGYLPMPRWQLHDLS
jgi:hypothetical protein